MSIKVKPNFDFDKLAKSVAFSLWLNQYGNGINASIQDGLKKSVDIHGNRFKSSSEFTHNSVHDGHAHKRPLVRSGRMSDTRKSPATPKKLKFTIKGGIKKSKARWNLVVDGKKYSGTRKSKGVNYGAIHNKKRKTHKDSLIPNKTVPKREWFGIPSSFLVGGKDWRIMIDKFQSYMQKYMKIAMKEHK